MLAPFVPTPAICINAALRLLQIENSKIFYDLGGGDGRFSFHALLATQSSKSMICCVEKDKRLCDIARTDFKKWCRMYGISEKEDRKRFRLLEQDIVNTDFSDATHIYTYLTAEGIEEITPIFNKSLHEGTRIVSCEYAISNWKPLEIETYNGLSLYLYEIGQS